MNESDILRLQKRIAVLERQVAFLLEHLELVYEDNPAYSISPEMLDAIRRNNIIEAIKLYREKTGASLKESKDAVDELMLRYRQGML